MVKAKKMLMLFPRMRIIFLLGPLAFAQCAGPSPEMDASPRGFKGEMEKHNPRNTVGSKGNPKLASSLNQLLEAYRQGGMAEAQAFAMSHNMILQDERVQVTIVTTEEAIGDVRDAVEASGGEYQLHYKNLLQALVPIGELGVLVQRSDIKIIREPRRLITP